jgi:hypothetical protein
MIAAMLKDAINMRLYLKSTQSNLKLDVHELTVCSIFYYSIDVGLFQTCEPCNIEFKFEELSIVVYKIVCFWVSE